ncbi:MAG: alpha/beta fold hydrolase [Lachnospiraceae bacterium]|nr:alpha/beta fold hydrolase [Lachnospiraceae bacterium]
MHRYFEINESGHNIRCKLYYQDLKNIRRIVLFCHGFGGHKDNGAAEKFAIRLLTKYKGCAMVTFDWPGHGDDVKKGFRLEDCMIYLRLVLEYICRQYQPDDIYSYAISFGGYITLKYVMENGNPFKKIALRCPAVNVYDVMTTTIMSSEDHERLKKGKDVPVGFDRKVMVGTTLLEEMKENDIQKLDFIDYAEDILMIHGTEDEIVSFEVVQEFAENNIIEFIPVEGADHRFRNERKMETAIKSILDFYDL